MITYFSCPLGIVRMTGDASGVSAISILDSATVNETSSQITTALDPTWPEPLKQAYDQLHEYFAGNRQSFDFLMNPVGTAFQQRVWQSLLTVPFGQTLSYLSLSRQLGDEKAIRAVAAANGRNPLWLVVPCHRIIGSDGSLTGYAGGLWRKQWLLEHEGAFPKTAQLALF
jgi:methylated-DNA-[protein]-cysteine S-methyltransferase